MESYVLPSTKTIITITTKWPTYFTLPFHLPNHSTSTFLSAEMWQRCNSFWSCFLFRAVLCLSPSLLLTTTSLCPPSNSLYVFLPSTCSHQTLTSRLYIPKPKLCFFFTFLSDYKSPKMFLIVAYISQKQVSNEYVQTYDASRHAD